MGYNFTEIEKKWREKWKDMPINKEDPAKKKFYCLDMFPYPSASGLHVGHWRGYVLSDVLSRYKILQGYHVLHPMGWDAFGLPAENYAISMKVHPAKSTAENVASVKKQLHEISAVYDWSREIDTTDPAYYKWTQWIFVQMFKKGLAYEQEMPLNWCPSCACVLANEEAVGGVCERCSTTVTKKMLRQWMLKITAYAERLLQDLETLDWPDKVKKMQADWIGKSYGAEVNFRITGCDDVLSVFTTRADTLYGVTFMVLAPEHPLAEKLTSPAQKKEVDAYILSALTKSSVDRMADREKTGVFTGSYAINPINGKEIPIWVADYVLIDYGTGAIMGVPAHDERDLEFAQKFNLPVETVIDEETGRMINSGAFNGKTVEEAISFAAAYVEEQRYGKKMVNYKLRDWVFSRQRYWGEPIPVIHCAACGIVPVPEDELPVLLPEVESYMPTGTGESPLAAIDWWVNTTCPVCGGAAKRETNTMPQWAGSSWYFLRYADPHNSKELASKEALEKWLPVDYYVGGIEHAVLHLLYSRFYTKFLYDCGVVHFEEPFTKLFNQGMLNRSGAKMSKSKGNTVSPDGLVEKYGCDSLRMYELFVGPPEADAEWDDSGIDGVFRYLNKAWRLVTENKNRIIKPTTELERARHQMIYEITSRMDNMSMNTVISGFMEYTRKIGDAVKESGGIDKETLESLIIMLSPFAPHIAEELWELTGHKKSVFFMKWPHYDKSKMKEDTIEIAVQINGKVRATITVGAATNKESILAAAKEAVNDKLQNAQVVKEIYVPGKIVNIVI